MSDMVEKIARKLYSMAKNGKSTNDIAWSMDHERYQRTWTDEGIFASKARPGFRPLSFEQRIEWELLARQGKL
jgi:hypothetical protein